MDETKGKTSGTITREEVTGAGITREEVTGAGLINLRYNNSINSREDTRITYTIVSGGTLWIAIM